MQYKEQKKNVQWQNLRSLQKLSTLQDVIATERKIVMVNVSQSLTKAPVLKVLHPKARFFIRNLSNSDLFTCEGNMLSSLMKISCFALKLTW